eukprot:g12942.t1
MDVVLLRLDGPAADADAPSWGCLLLLFLLLFWLSTGEFVPGPCFGVRGASGGRAPRGAWLTFFSLSAPVMATGRSRSTAAPSSLVGVRRMSQSIPSGFYSMHSEKPPKPPKLLMGLSIPTRQAQKVALPTLTLWL